MKFKIISLFCANFFFIYSLSAQITQDFIEMAKDAGVTENQVQQQLGNLSTQQGTRQLADDPVNVSDRMMVRGEGTSVSVIGRKDIDSKNTVFGREIFNNENLTFAPEFNIPTPKDYQLSSGDEILINVWGDSEINLNRTISPEGNIFIPNIGPIYLSGFTIEEAESRIRTELGKIISNINDDNTNTFVSVSLGKIRSLKINIVGEVLTPGTYTLPSLATVFNALYVAGGVNSIGSLRNIKVFRNSKEIVNLDVYDYLLYGISSSNIRLEDNDVILVGPYDQLISINGHVKRNRTFELKKGENLQLLLGMAGGFTGDAYVEEVSIRRKTGDNYRIETVAQSRYDNFEMYDGDVVSVSGAIQFYENRLAISGAVWRPGEYELTQDVNTVKKLIVKAKGLKGDEFADRARLIRLNEDFTTTLIPINIKGIMDGTVPDFALQNEDKLHISSHFDLREPYSIRVRGAVNHPGEFVFRHNMTIEDVIVLAGGLKESASIINVEVARRIKNPMSTHSNNTIAETFSFTLSDDLIIQENENNFILEPFDEVFVRYSPEYSRQQVVHVRGEVTFVGDYVLSEKNYRLTDVIKQAGGITPDAYVRGANLKRKITRDELRRIETLLEISNNQSNEDSLSISSMDFKQYTVGIDLEKALAKPGGIDDLVLQDGDELYIPQLQNTVKISGAVNYPNSVTFSNKANVKTYLSLSGGYLDNARKYPIVIYMNGMVATTKKTALFFKKYPKVEPGSEIIVPMKITSERKLSPVEIMSITSSSTSMAAMITSLINTLSK